MNSEPKNQLKLSSTSDQDQGLYSQKHLDLLHLGSTFGLNLVHPLVWFKVCVQYHRIV